MCIVQELDPRTKFTFIGISAEGSEQFLYFTSIEGIEYKIPMANVYYYCRAANHRMMSLGSLNEFVNHKIEDGDYFEEIQAKIY